MKSESDRWWFQGSNTDNGFWLLLFTIYDMIWCDIHNTSRSKHIVQYLQKQPRKKKERREHFQIWDHFVYSFPPSVNKTQFSFFQPLPGLMRVPNNDHLFHVFILKKLADLFDCPATTAVVAFIEPQMPTRAWTHECQTWNK